MPKPPELIVVLDLEFMLVMVRDGFMVGIVLITHINSYRRRTKSVTKTQG